MPLAAMNTPGGFHSFEHRWAVAQAFEFHRAIGKARIAERIHALNSHGQGGDGEDAQGQGAHADEPRSFGRNHRLRGRGTDARARSSQKLHERGIIASVTPGFYNPQLARVAPSMLTLEDDVDRTVRAIAAL